MFSLLQQIKTIKQTNKLGEPLSLFLLASNQGKRLQAVGGRKKSMLPKMYVKKTAKLVRFPYLLPEISRKSPVEPVLHYSC